LPEILFRAGDGIHDKLLQHSDVVVQELLVLCGPVAPGGVGIVVNKDFIDDLTYILFSTF
jgi:hypothetical protein